MTINEAIQVVDSIRPNQYDAKQKKKWLITLERKIGIEIYDKYGHLDGDSFTDFNSETLDDDPLYVNDAYADMYVYYLCSMIDFHNAEYSRYNADCDLFNDKWEGYCSYYVNTHMPNQDNVCLKYKARKVYSDESPFTS